MAEETVGHKCRICGSVWKTRKRAKTHVNVEHEDKVYAQHGPGQHVKYLLVDLSKY